MTKANSILHRAAALLAALCLLASMALPVYAAEDEGTFFVASTETIPADGNTDNDADGTGTGVSVPDTETVPEGTAAASDESKSETEISAPDAGTVPNGTDTSDEAAGAPHRNAAGSERYPA